jgi:hypothetical protein
MAPCGLTFALSGRSTIDASDRSWSAISAPHDVGRGSAVARAQAAPPGQHTIFVRRRQLDREITEGPRLTRQEPAGLPFLLRKNGGGTAAVFDLARDHAHLARATAATSAAEHDARPRPEDGGQHGLLGTTGDGVADRAQGKREHLLMCRRSRTSRSVPASNRKRQARSGPVSTGWRGSPGPSGMRYSPRRFPGGCRKDRRNRSSSRA